MKISMALIISAVASNGCSFEQLKTDAGFYELVGCHMEGDKKNKLQTANENLPGVFRTIDDHALYPEGFPQGGQCVKVRCPGKPSVYTSERIGCYEGEWMPLLHTPGIGYVPQFNVEVIFPSCDFSDDGKL
ncbi:Oidioi.mRNA.OKI2018_I69.PAR.g11126.t1.cds [Oikopleura dioica]|uniref:Oidioi.mRNA.OKI2018_I69.PAR.g11126.t1.cds n=1 Tax=Oikopleura dioica TaxID=34765 RepID=A0ABN7RUX8_OIKDI|nr:Oidioi.mRNA.OKI2018_I69.PAR.g11126.t1.cds [Oikopleura dioica]